MKTQYYSSEYENLLFTSDLNCSMNKKTLADFYEKNSLHGLVHEPTFYKNPKNSSCTNVKFKNKSLSLRTQSPRKNSYRILIKLLPL